MKCILVTDEIFELRVLTEHLEERHEIITISTPFEIYFIRVLVKMLKQRFVQKYNQKRTRGVMYFYLFT